MQWPVLFPQAVWHLCTQQASLLPQVFPLVLDPQGAMHSNGGSRIMRCSPSRMGVVEAVARAAAYAKRKAALAYIFVEELLK